MNVYDYIEQTKYASPLVSVIIRTYGDRQSFLREAVTSVLKQKYENFEIVIVEDGGHNAQPFINELSSNSLLRIQYLPQPKVGRCVAGNIGLAAAKGEYFCFLDDDDRFYPEHLQILVEAVHQHNVLAAYTDAEEVSTTVKSLDPLIYKELGRKVIYSQNFSRPLLWVQNYIAIQSVLFHRSLYERYGGLVTHLDALEDWNLWTRYSLTDDFYHINKVTSMYRVPAKVDNSLERISKMDNFKAVARKEHQAMKLQMSVDEFLRMHDELNVHSCLIYIDKEMARKCILENCVLRNCYGFLRKIYYYWRR